MKQIICDNGSVFVSFINKLFYHIFGIKKFKLLAYTPWGSGFVENTMKNINLNFRIETMRREINGFRKLINEGIIKNELRIIIRAAELTHNHTKKFTGYKPIELNRAVKSPFILDIMLRLERNNLLKDKVYIEKDQKINYKKYMELTQTAAAALHKTAKLNKLTELNKRNIRSELEQHQSYNLQINDFVTYRRDNKNKKDQNDTYGWIITGYKDSEQGKRTYSIKNLLTNETENKVNKGHLQISFRPLRNARNLLQNETANIIDLESKEKDEEFEEFLKENQRN